MKKKKTIKIRNPRLRTIRNNLRSVLIAFAVDKVNEISSNYQRDKSKIRKILSRSICMCPSCSRSKEDMTFNLELKEWYCIECYKLVQYDYKQRKVLRDKGEDYGDFREEFYKSFI
ncbi:MAG: hypothetical protein KGD67_09840 [Candidatus Lokiarchaeota archaeon]|nr:hypothetical protein [Candidatus Lokiarchaeota archaeon]